MIVLTRGGKTRDTASIQGNKIGSHGFDDLVIELARVIWMATYIRSNRLASGSLRGYSHVWPPPGLAISPLLQWTFLPLRVYPILRLGLPQQLAPAQV